MKLSFLNHRQDGSNLILTYVDEGGNPFHFIGNCTVWNRFPSFTRQPTEVESELSDQWQRIRHNERSKHKVPTEHEFEYNPHR